MATRYRSGTTTTNSKSTEQREADQIRKELREDILREVKSMTSQWMKEIESEFSQTIKESLNSSSGNSASTDSGLLSLTGIGTSLASIALGYISSSLSATRTRTSTSTTSATETGRSQDENAFYRQSLAQKEAAANLAAQRGSRNV